MPFRPVPPRVAPRCEMASAWCGQRKGFFGFETPGASLCEVMQSRKKVMQSRTEEGESGARRIARRRPRRTSWFQTGPSGARQTKMGAMASPLESAREGSRLQAPGSRLQAPGSRTAQSIVSGSVGVNGVGVRAGMGISIGMSVGVGCGISNGVGVSNELSHWLRHPHSL